MELNLDEHLALLNAERKTKGLSALTRESLGTQLDDFYRDVKKQLLLKEDSFAHTEELYPLFVGHNKDWSARAANLALMYARQRLLKDEEFYGVIDSVHLGEHILVIYPGWDDDERKRDSEIVMRIVERIKQSPPLVSCVRLCDGEDVVFLREHDYVEDLAQRKLYFHAGHVIWDMPIAVPPARDAAWETSEC